MKPAREPASSRPKPYASLKKPHESCPFAAPCDPRRKKNDRGQTSAFPSEISRVKPSPGSSTIELPSAFTESGAYPFDRALPGSPRQCSLPLAYRHPPEGHQIGAQKKRAPGNTILSQPYRRRVSTDWLNREGSQLAAFLEGEPGPPTLIPRNQVSEGGGTLCVNKNNYFVSRRGGHASVISVY